MTPPDHPPESPDGRTEGDARRDEAGAAEAFAASHTGYDLDFTPAALARLDDLVEELATDEVDAIAPGLTAYLGETYVRSYGGTWADRESTAWVVEVPDGDGEPRALVLPTVVEDCLTGGATFAAVHDAFVDRLGRDGPRLAGDGSADGDATIRRLVEAVAAEPTTDPVAEVAEHRRAAAGALAAEWPGYDLDFSVESLVRLDALVADHYDRSGGDREYEGDPLSVPEGTTLTFDGSAEAFGGYLAAVFERHHDAAWRGTDEGNAVLVEGHDGAAEVEPELVAVACFAGESSFVDAYAHVAAEVGLDVPLGE